jgi:hypothetical protein
MNKQLWPKCAWTAQLADMFESCPAREGTSSTRSKVAGLTSQTHDIHKGKEESDTDFIVDNLAHGATCSTFAIPMLLKGELDKYDVIIISYTANDDNADVFFDDGTRDLLRSFETLVRSLLQLPKKPAVILFEDTGRWDWYSEARTSTGLGSQLVNDLPKADDMHRAVASIYGVPVISAKNAYLNSKVIEDLGTSLDFSDKSTNMIHVGYWWHAKFACLVFGNWELERQNPLQLDMDSYLVEEKEPSARFDGHTLSSACKIIMEGASHNGGKNAGTGMYGHISKIVYQNVGWKFMEDVPGKPGFISKHKGDHLSFRFSIPANLMVTVYVNYLRSYTAEWGAGELRTCDGQTIPFNSRTHDHSSQSAQLRVVIKQHAKTRNCEIKILNTSENLKLKTLDFHAFSSPVGHLC